MRTSEAIDQLGAALAIAQGQLESAKKDSINPAFKQGNSPGSKYASLAAVLDAIREPFASNGLSFVQMPTIENDQIYLVNRLMHKSGQWVEGEYPINPVQNTPQSLGTAISYARRYSIQSIAGLAAEDDDGNAASGRSDDPKKLLYPSMDQVHEGSRSADPKANRQEAKAAAMAVAETKLAALPEKQVMMSRAELSGWLPRASRAMINNALADVANRLDARYGTGYATALRSEALGVFKAAKSSELSDENAKLVLLQLYGDLQKPDDPKAKGETPDNELQEYLDGMTDVGSTVFAFKLLSDRLAKAIGSDAARNDYHAILEKQGVKHSNEFKGKGMDAKAKAALTELYHLVVKEEGVPA